MQCRKECSDRHGFSVARPMWSESDSMSRYAVTTVESTTWNQLHITKEAAFEVDLSSSAFISNFTIVYQGTWPRRHTRSHIYVHINTYTCVKNIEKFRVAVNVPPGTRVSFTLTYEELLSRRLGRYELSLGLRPGQPVQNISLDVSISERTGISYIRALPLQTSRLLANKVQDADPPPSTKVEQNPYCAYVRYTPSIQQQKNISPRGLNADFVIQYDVEFKDPMGDIQVDDGYFVHYFAPRGLPVVPKDVIFVIDISGSMIGTKIKQTKAAMTTILSDLREGDYFNLITFSDKVYTWKKGRTVRATLQNVRDKYCNKLIFFLLTPGTNINAALLSAAQLLNPSSHSSSSSGHAPSSHRVPMIIFLTDGEATTGETEPDVILRNAQNALGLASLFGLAFGDDADFPMLRRLALENRGVARMVYEDNDAAVQLKGFFDEVASPLLSDIQLSYLDDQVYDITRSLFPNYFQGSELVVTGRLKPGVQDLKVMLTANNSKQKVKVENELPLAKAVINGTEPSLGCAQALDGIPKYFVSLKVDGDPHFVVQFPKLHQNLCFTIDGRADDVLRLLEDPDKGIIVDGHLMLAPSKEGLEIRTRTFFDRISIIAGKGGVMITLTLDSVQVEADGKEIETLPTNQRGSVEQHGMRITVEEHHSCWIELGVGVQFLILFHLYNHPKSFQMEHLGFYIADGKGLSHLTQGLLGRVSRDQAGFHHAQTNKNTSLAMGLLKKGDEHFPVTLQDKNLKDSPRKRHLKTFTSRLHFYSYKRYRKDTGT
uniref:Inter-alpha-trypsin inhibitor heavy chain H6-like n=1 Tax=Sinocyclocheilus grahami TaxID=75366 RepID=A0A672LIS1_SINGR